MTDPVPRYIDTAAGLDAWLAHIAPATAIAVDTESDSFHHYQEKVCLIQMTVGEDDAIIDPLAIDSLKPLAPLFADPNRVKIFHDAGYDVICLRRDFNFRFAALFDTMLASRLLGYKHFGLATILQDRFGFTADKRHQRSDWARRPLTPEQLAYARYDTRFLPRLAEALEAELHLQKRWEWAQEDFARLPELADRAAAREPETPELGFWRVRGVKLLSPVAKGRLQKLWLLRDQIAARLDRPPFKVFGDPIMIEIAKQPPDNLRDLQPRPGLRRGGIEKFGPQILAAMATAVPIHDGPPAGATRRRRTGRLFEPDARDRYEALRTLRRAHAEAMGLEPEVALSNALLEDLARRPPPDVEDARTRLELRGWRGTYLAKPIVEMLKSPVPEAPRSGRDRDKGEEREVARADASNNAPHHDDVDDDAL